MLYCTGPKGQAGIGGSRGAPGDAGSPGAPGKYLSWQHHFTQWLLLELGLNTIDFY